MRQVIEKNQKEIDRSKFEISVQDFANLVVLGAIERRTVFKILNDLEESDADLIINGLLKRNWGDDEAWLSRFEIWEVPIKLNM
jgi:hypothetical protein